jgi:membrane dipeptidase
MIYLWLVFFLACQPTSDKKQEGTDETLQDMALRLSQELMLIDTHIDVPYRLAEHWEDISGSTENGHFDYNRAQAGGLDVPFMSIYVGAEYQKTGGAKEKADELIEIVRKFTTDWPDKYALANNPEDLEEQFKKGLISLPMGMENGAPIEDEISNIKYFYDRGIRYITLCHSKWNQICDSSYDLDKHWNGLSPFGVEVIREMNQIGMMIDISHVSDSTFYQVVELTKAPLVATHSSCRYYTPGFERNMSDDMIKRLAQNGGVIQINFGSYFVNGDYQSKMQKAWDNIDNRSELTADERNKYLGDYKKENQVPIVQIDEVVDHIDHVVSIVGIDHVGIGSDYDGVSDLPEQLTDVSMYPNLIFLLLEKGYTEEDIAKIWSGNILRVWKKVEETGHKLQNDF